MTPQSVVADPDFPSFVRHAISIKKLKFTEEFDEVVQGVALRILKFGVGNNIKFPTLIIQNTIWHSRDCKLKRDKRIKCKQLIDQKSNNNKDLDHVDNRDEAEKLFKEFNSQQKQILKMLMCGKKQAEIAKELNYTHQNVSHVIMKLRKKYATIH